MSSDFIFGSTSSNIATSKNFQNIHMRNHEGMYTAEHLYFLRLDNTRLQVFVFCEETIFSVQSILSFSQSKKIIQCMYTVYPKSIIPIALCFPTIDPLSGRTIYATIFEIE